MELIYNLTGHICKHPDVESEPRVDIMIDPRDINGSIKAVKEIAHKIPRKSRVLIGGHSQLMGLLLQVAKIKQWEVFYYSTYDDRVYSAAFLSRMDRLEIEREM